MNEPGPETVMAPALTKERLIDALGAMPDGAPVKFGMYVGEGQWAVSPIIGILVGAGDDEVTTILLRVPTPEALGVLAQFEEDYEPGTPN